MFLLMVTEIDHTHVIIRAGNFNAPSEFRAADTYHVMLSFCHTFIQLSPTRMRMLR